MKRIDIVRRASRGLKQAKARTLLTSLAIAVGAFTLTISLAAGEGSRQYADTLIGSNINPQALFVVKDKSLLGEGVAQPNSGVREYDPDVGQLGSGGPEVKQLTQKDIDALSARDDLEAVQPIYQVAFEYFTLQNNDTKYSSELTTYDSGIQNETAAGQLPPLGESLGDKEVIVPESATDTLGVSPGELIGKEITLTLERPANAPSQEEIQRIFATEGQAGLSKLSEGETKKETFTVRAVTKQSATSLNQSSALAVSANAAREMSEFLTKDTDAYQKYGAATVRAKSGQDPETVKQRLSDEGYGAQTAQDLQELLFTIVNILQGIVIGFGIIALIASVFGIINTQYISVLERTQQIGLMKALGMRGRDVAKLFRYEAAWIGFLGGVIGAGFAIALGTLLNPWITEQLSLGDGNYLLIFQPIPVIALIVALMLIAVIAGYFPARKAAKLDPIEALRTE